MIFVESEADKDEVEQLFDLCFAPGRQALSSYRLRENVPAVQDLCLTFRDNGLAGAVRCWPVRIGQTHDALLLGPLAVHPTREGEGLGTVLITELAHRAAELGHQRILLVGDAPYYARHGYRPVDGVIMPPPTNPDRVLGLALCAGAWDGVQGMVTQALGVAQKTPIS